MNAPAAAQLRRTTPAQMAAQPARQAPSSAQDPRDSASFAAHLERGMPDRLNTERPPSADTRPASAPPRAARPDTAAPAASRKDATQETANEAATGKTLPDKRQTPAETRTQTASAQLAGQGEVEDETVGSDAATQEGEVKTAATTGSDLLLPALLIANMPSPASVLPAATLPAAPVSAVALPTAALPATAGPAGLPQVGTAARLGANSQISACLLYSPDSAVE